MTKREKVLAGLRCWTQENTLICGECGYHSDDDSSCAKRIMADALELLTPRVMTYDELATFDGAFLLESSAISELDWVFFFDTDSRSDALWVESCDGERYVVYREDYGKYVRCWTARPTEAQREAEAWKS